MRPTWMRNAMTRIMKAFCAAFLACLLCLAAAGAEAEPTKYPTAGHSTGSDVRLRNDPGTEGTEIVGMVSALHLVVLGETSVEGTDGTRWNTPRRRARRRSAAIFLSWRSSATPSVGRLSRRGLAWGPPRRGPGRCSASRRARRTARCTSSNSVRCPGPA